MLLLASTGPPQYIYIATKTSHFRSWTYYLRVLHTFPARARGHIPYGISVFRLADRHDIETQTFGWRWAD